MYDELVKQLRESKVVVFRPDDVTILTDAADAIEELTTKYERALCDLVKQAEPPKEK